MLPRPKNVFTQVDVCGSSLPVSEVTLDLEEFTQGRLSTVPAVKGPDEQVCTEKEKALFRSAVGDLHWVSSQSRPDCAVYASRLQKVQNHPTLGDYRELARVLRELRDTAGDVLKIKAIEDPVDAVWTDSSLFGAQGEQMPDDFAVPKEERQNFHSQGGYLVALIPRGQLQAQTASTDISILDWKTRASKRVLHSTFAAEATTALEAVGHARCIRVYLAEILFRGNARRVDVQTLDEESVFGTVCFADCKSLFDNVLKDASVPSDKLVAISVACLRGVASAGPQRDLSRTELRWLPTRWQLADALTRIGLGKLLRIRMAASQTCLFELSAAAVRKQK